MRESIFEPSLKVKRVSRSRKDDANSISHGSEGLSFKEKIKRKMSFVPRTEQDRNLDELRQKLNRQVHDERRKTVDYRRSSFADEDYRRSSFADQDYRRSSFADQGYRRRSYAGQTDSGSDIDNLRERINRTIKEKIRKASLPSDEYEEGGGSTTHFHSDGTLKPPFHWAPTPYFISDGKDSGPGSNSHLRHLREDIHEQLLAGRNKKLDRLSSAEKLERLRNEIRNALLAKQRRVTVKEREPSRESLTEQTSTDVTPKSSSVGKVTPKVSEKVNERCNLPCRTCHLRRDLPCRPCCHMGNESLRDRVCDERCRLGFRQAVCRLGETSSAELRRLWHARRYTVKASIRGVHRIPPLPGDFQSKGKHRWRGYRESPLASDVSFDSARSCAKW